MPTKRIDPRGIKAVFFDAGGTLFRPEPSVGEVYAEVAAHHGFTAPAEKIEKVFHELWTERDGLASLRGHSSEKKEREWWRGLVWDVFSKLEQTGDRLMESKDKTTCPLFVGEIEDFEAFFAELYDRFARPETWVLFPDALPTLKALKKHGKILGIVSNWDSRLFGICEGLGVRQHLDFVLASAVVGAAKPSPKIFQEALKQVGAAPHEALHVGDSLEDDVLGAERAGIQALFLDRKGNRPPHPLKISTLQFLCGKFEDYRAE